MKALTRPFIFFVHEPIIQLLGIFMAFVYGLMYSACNIFAVNTGVANWTQYS